MSTALRVEHATVKFGGLMALDDLSLSLTQGELLGVIGPNGAGKTTLLNAISGVSRLKSGSISLGESPITGLRPDQIAARGVARTFQGADFFSDFTVLESLMMGRWQSSDRSVVSAIFRLPSARRREREQKAAALTGLEQLGLAHLAGSPLAALPYGTRKLVDVVRAMLSEPSVLLLDEPTSGTTVEDRERLRELILEIKRAGVSVVLVDHDVTFTADVSDTAMAMNFGKVLGTGTPHEVLDSPEVRAAYVGLEEK